jgi:hypothetical protein
MSIVAAASAREFLSAVPLKEMDSVPTEFIRPGIGDISAITESPEVISYPTVYAPAVEQLLVLKAVCLNTRYKYSCHDTSALPSDTLKLPLFPDRLFKSEGA